MPLQALLTFIAVAGLILPAEATAQVPLPQAVTIFDGTTLTQSVTVSVQDISVLSVSGNVTLTIDSATPGAAPNAEADSGTTYSLTVNGTGKKMTAALDSAFPSGISIDLLLAAPSGASATQRTLSAVAQDVLSSIETVQASGLSIAYTATATSTVAPNGGGVSRTVTLTLTDE